VVPAARADSQGAGAKGGSAGQARSLAAHRVGGWVAAQVLSLAAAARTVDAAGAVPGADMDVG